MLNDEGGGVGQNTHEECSESCSNLGPDHSSKEASPSQSGALQKGMGPGAITQSRHMGGSVHLSTLSIMISNSEDTPNPNMSISKSEASEGDERITVVAAASKKVFLPRCESYKDQCRVCQQQTEEPLIDLGCRCRGELANVHRSCIEIWFRTKGSNKCEICQQVASNVSFPEPHPSTNYWVWRVNSAHGRGQQQHERGCLSPLWVAFALLIGGLFLDVLISVSLGISSLPVNIITGVLIVLGLAAALRLSLECCQELGATRNIQTDVTLNPGYHPAV
ncbi:hypothetical protein Cni_G15843 [Canna indica]|uniref:RING-CH-type domain-containing protein n=1 Tax=Canna indica TaxID=4628 RepID=A0AAQ3KK53_9LILI|nr:hypothetical protein Cni_G15843 [Canna indica]